MVGHPNEIIIGVDEKEIAEQIDRILHSEELRTSEVLRRLLKFLAEKSASGEADELKEYIVAIDGMGKPASYDPRHDSAVRIQVGRLRQKLADYYRTEGREDPIIVDVPKGRFKLHYELRPEPTTVAALPPQPGPASLEPVHPAVPLDPIPPARSSVPSSNVLLAVGGVMVLLMLFGAFALGKMQSQASTSVLGFTPELEALWQPFIGSQRPLITAIEDPLFVEFHNGSGLYMRDKNINDWKDVASSPAINAVRSLMKDTDMQPSRYYTAYGEVNSAFQIARLLGSRIQNFTVTKTSTLSYQQLADNNVIFIGVQYLFFGDQLKAMPVQAQFLPVAEGIRNLHPASGEPGLFADQYTTAPNEEGVMYALVSHLPGPLGSNDIESFTSSRSAGYVAAIMTFTNPSSAKGIVDKLKSQSGGHMPRYYQVLLRVQFKAGVPTDTECVLTRELR